MNVRQLIQNLMSMDMDAEVMVDAPLSASHGPSHDATAHLTIPVRSVSAGKFQGGQESYPAIHMSSQDWVSINGTDAWGLNQGIEKVK